MITATIKKKIEAIVNVFETGTPEGRYDALVKFKDYTDPATKNTLVQITYGRAQTTEFGNLHDLIETYINKKGQLASQLKPYLSRVGKQPSLATDKTFCDLLKKAGKTDPVMRDAQDDFFDSYYYLPALGWFKQMGFTLPLSLLVIYDSFIHSGGILTILRERFTEVPPVKGGDEKKWISQYVAVREKWLATHKKSVLHATVYRTQTFRNEIKKNNWQLQQPVNAHGVLVA